MFEALVIVNLTPDSFSDGGVFLNTDIVSDFIDKNINDGVRYFDFGAESTAPFNDPISADTEIERLSPYLSLFKDKEIQISLDTYHCKTVKWFLEHAAENLIWNDVSGVLDEDTLEILRTNPQLEYVLAHTNIPSKAKTSFHMDYLCTGPIVNQVVTKWTKDIAILNDHKIDLTRVWFDPCFGFSKSYEQNFELIKKLPEIEQELAIKKWVLGISKKSFLRKKVANWGVIDNKQQFHDSEILHYEIVKYWKTSLEGAILLRLHNKVVYDAASLFLSEFYS